MTWILVIDDEPGIVRFVSRALIAAGYDVETASNGVDGLRRASEQRFDLITLDLRLPGLGGMAVLTALMEQDPGNRVLVLSAAEGVQERVRCLESGAADFLAKPFAVAELLARIKSRLPAPTGQPAAPTIETGRVQLDPHRRTVTADGRVIELSAREYRVLVHLMTRADRACSRQELLSEVWGLAFDPGSNVVDVCVARLRAKLAGAHIQTVRNVGYAFVSA